MASHAVTGQYVPIGVNHGNQFFVDAIVAQVLANAETFDVTIPDGAPVDALPLSVLAYAPLNGGVYVVNTNIGLTNHNPTTGVSRCTATGAVAAGSRVRLVFAGI